MCTARPACRKKPWCWATYSAAFPTPGTDATVMEDPAGACSAAPEEPDPGIWQPASSTAATAAQPAAIRARPLLQGRAGQRRAGFTFIAPRASDSRFWQFRTGCSGRAYLRLTAVAEQTSQIADILPVTPVYLCGV